MSRRADRIRRDPWRWRKNGIPESNRELADMALEAFELQVSYGKLTQMSEAQKYNRRIALLEK
ncbi:MAG: hypothetical protein VB035_06060 [Candidatus Fimivivens sp.]|nr:hypothetical protein [Candidatus Fimivivens sp.]